MNPYSELANNMNQITATATAPKKDEWKSFNCFLGTTFLFQTRCTEKGLPATEAYLNGLVAKGFLTSFTAEKREQTVVSVDDISAMFA